jgi:hypothetical protein
MVYYNISIFLYRSTYKSNMHYDPANNHDSPMSSCFVAPTSRSPPCVRVSWHPHWGCFVCTQLRWIDGQFLQKWLGPEIVKWVQKLSGYRDILRLFLCSISEVSKFSEVTFSYFFRRAIINIGFTKLYVQNHGPARGKNIVYLFIYPF